ncbi:MAG: site-specific integrase [Mucilaginibacter polytrichastri]|nr:site-specific integrase [Mucilaginibacter polytrichastri]
MKTTFSLLFYLKKPKHFQGGTLPIYIRITVNGGRAETSTGRECLLQEWNASAGRLKGTKEKVKSFNAYLDDLQAKVYQCHRLMTELNQAITAESLRNTFLGKTEKPHLLIETFEEHNRKVEALVGDEFAAGTLCRYQTSLKHTRDFLLWKYKIKDLDIRKVDHLFITEYEFYLKTVRKCANNSAVKYIKNFKKIVRICIANGWLTSDPFVNYKAKIKAVERVFLSPEELKILANKNITNERLAQVRDIFLFCCFTGLAYVDVQKLRRSDMITGVDGGTWISIKRQKTDTPARIPLLASADLILKRYADHPHCSASERVLPVSTNQKMNAYLKEIADICGIAKPITFHIARHTFATTVTLLNGVSIESVAKMLGHKNIQTTQHYAKVLDAKVSRDMARLKEIY